jgi:mercuric reductase
MNNRYDVIVIGAGTAGINAAHAAATAGARTVLVNDGPTVTACAAKNCMPSKALLAATHVAHTARNAAPFGVLVDGPVTADFGRIVAQVKEQVRLFTRSVEEGVERAVNNGKYDLIIGRAEFVPGGKLRVNGRRLQAKRYVLATGSVPVIPPLARPSAVPYITSDDVLDLSEAPASLLILGAGPVGLELAEVFARVGTEVVLVDRGSVLDDFDPEFADEFCRYAAAETGLTLWTHARVTEIRPAPQGTGLTYIVEQDGQQYEHEAEKLLVATGRQPAVHGLGLEHVGLRLRQGALHVNTAMQSDNPHIYLAGDIVAPQILHIAAEEGRVAGHNAAAGYAEQTVDYARLDLVVIFTSLTAARTGLTEAQACQAGREVVTASDWPAQSGRGITNKDAFGLWKLVADAHSGQVLGGQILETDADASIHLVKMAINAELDVGDVSKMVVYHPTRAERLKGLADQICKQLGTRSAVVMCPQ